MKFWRFEMEIVKLSEEQMKKIKQAIIVEGTYDKIKLSSYIDANIIVCNGFEVFKNREKQEYIKKLKIKLLPSCMVEI